MLIYKILANIINKVFPKITEDNKTYIDNKWIYNYNKSLELLTKEEQNWIEKNPATSSRCSVTDGQN